MRARPSDPVDDRPSPAPPASGARRRLGAFFALTFGWSWSWLGLAWLAGPDASSPPAAWFRLTAGVGPALAAAVLIRRLPPGDRRAFWRRVVEHRSITSRWWAAIAVFAAGPAVAAWALVERADAALAVTGVTALTGVVAFALAASFAEEPGWRGYAADAVGHRWSLPTAGLVLGAVWAAWHLPLYALAGTFQKDEVGFATTMFWMFSAAFVPQTVLMLWVLDRTGRSVLGAVAFHALINISGEVLELSTAAQAARLGLWVALAAIVVTLQRSDRHARRTLDPSAPFDRR